MADYLFILQSPAELDKRQTKKLRMALCTWSKPRLGQCVCAELAAFIPSGRSAHDLCKCVPCQITSPAFYKLCAASWIRKPQQPGDLRLV